MELSTQQQILVEQRLANEMKATGVAYLLWFFLGGFGAHRFYMGKTGTAVAQLLLFLLFWLYIPVIILGIWWVVDAFLIPGMIEQRNRASRTRIANEVSLTTRNDNLQNPRAPVASQDG